jgi:hypothetical protein
MTVEQLLSDAPADDHALLELALDWAGLQDAAARVGAGLDAVLVSGGYPGLAAAGAAPRLLGALDEPARFATPAVQVPAQAWEPIGLGAIQDLVQEAFGPVALDRSLARLDPVEPSGDLSRSCPDAVQYLAWLTAPSCGSAS